MTKQKILRDFLINAVKESIDKFDEAGLKKTLKQKNLKHYEFKNDCFNKEIPIKKNDFEEFFSRKEVKSKLEKLDDFDDIVGIVSGYSNTQIFLKRKLTGKRLVFSFMENYTKNVDDFKFDREVFEKIFKSFIKFLDSKILQVHYFTPLFRLSFPSRHNGKELDEIKLVKINEERFKIIKDSLVGDRAPPGSLRKLSYVLETSVNFEDNSSDEDKAAQKKFNTFLNAAHLFGKGDLKIGPIYKNYSPWMYNSSKILNMHEIVLGPNILQLNSSSYDELKRFHHEYCNVDFDKDWSFVQVAIDRFSSSILRNDPIDKIVDLNVALECLFSSSGETSLKISNRSAMIVGLNENDRENCWNFIKNTYRLRNDILHGRKGNDIDMTNDVIELEKIIRTSIRKFLNIYKNISKKELKSQSKTGDQNIRDYILNELDLGLINRTRLKTFSVQTTGNFD